MIFDFDSLTFQLGSALLLEGFFAFAARLIVSALVALACWLVSRYLKFRLMPTLTAHTKDMHRLRALHILLKGFAKPLPVFVWLAGLYLAAFSLPWAAGKAAAIHAGLTMLFRVASILVVAVGLWNSSELCGLLLGGVQSRLDITSSRTITVMFGKAYKVLVAVFCAITVLDELGYPVTSLITGVGLAGLTVSLAAQDSASNMFSGMMILLEHPFGIGDWISVGGVEGEVEDITFRSTKVRALDNSLYVLPNSSVSGATVNNGTNRVKRLFRFTLGVTYDATRPQLEHLMKDLDALLRGHEHVLADSVTVRLTGFGDSSIDILVSCYVDTPALAAFQQVQNSLNLDIMDVMAANGTSFAFPSTSVYIEKAVPAESFKM